MADLGNLKIKDTYQLVLQTDAGGNLQNLNGGAPSPFIVNGNLRYVDGNQASNYVLTSDGSGNASWAAAAGGTSHWSANTNGDIFNSGLTSDVGIGTSTPNEKLTVVGDISATTDVHASKVITTNDVEVGGKLNLTSLGTSYISLGAENKLALGATSVLYGNWKILDSRSFAFDTQSYFKAYRDSGTNRNTILGKSGGLDLSCTTTNTINLYSTSVLLGQTAPSQVNVSDVLKVTGDLHVDDYSLYVSASSGRTGINTAGPTHQLTVSGESINWTAFNVAIDSISFSNGANHLTYQPTNVTIPEALAVEGTSVRVLVGGVYYYGTTASNGGGGYGFANGRGYFGLTWAGANITITDETNLVISYGGVGPFGNHFAVYNDSEMALQVVGSTIMSGSTDLLDIFAPYDVISGGTF